jgi:hypothetical protein
METETGSYLPDEFGRCDRANCSYQESTTKGKKGVFD